jgi:hypothetical protein
MENIENKEKTAHFSAFRKIIHNIRNMLELTEEEKEFIKSINDDEKMELILEYDTVLQVLVRNMYKYM